MDALMVKFHLEENGFQMVFEGVEAIEDAVMEGLLTQVIPEVLNWTQRPQTINAPDSSGPQKRL